MAENKRGADDLTGKPGDDADELEAVDDDDLEDEDDLADEDDLDDEDDLEDEDDLDADEELLSPGRAARTDKLWTSVRIDPVEIALPGGVGYTLRAYRPASELATITRTASGDLDDFDAAAAAVLRRRRVTDDDEEFGEDELPEIDEKALEAEALAADNPEVNPRAADDDTDDTDDDLDDDEDDDTDEEDESEEDDEDEDEPSDEDNPVFLGRNGRVYLFHSQDKLVEFVRSEADHDMSHLDTWSDLVGRITVDDIDPLDDDRYELDLVVENLRGGPDAWDSRLILKAGEIARDLGQALRVEPVMVALAPGSPLDDLDETLRSVDEGGVKSFFAKRRLRKIPAQQSSLAWRTVIGKISSAADWRD